MGMKKLGKAKVMAIASLSAVVLLVASLAVAQKVKTEMQDGKGRHAWHGERMGRGRGGEDFLLGRLNLTDDQKAKVKQLRDTFQSTNKPLMVQLRAKRKEL